MRHYKLSSGQIIVTVTGFLCLFSLVGISFYGLPFFYDFWVKDFGWSRATITSGMAFGKVIIGTVAFFSGWIIDRFGPRRVMMAGVMMGGIALIGLSHVTALWQYYAFYLFNALGYICGGPLPNQVLISRWFTGSRGKAMGIIYLGIGIGGMLVPQIAKKLIVHFGWHNAMMLLGILMIIISFPMILFVKDNPELNIRTQSPDEPQPEEPLPAKPGPGDPRSDEPKAPLGHILKRWPFYLLLIGSICSIGAVSGTIQNLKLFFSIDLNWTQQHAANILSIVLASSIAGRLLMGWLADKINKKYVMILIYTLVAGSIPLLFIAATPGIIYVFAFIFGMALGGDYMIIPLMAAELFGVRILGRVMGLIMTFDGLSEAFSPMLVGWLRDISGSYARGFTALMVLGIIGIIAISMLPLKKKSI
jgi:sugar phosphate permease